MQVPIMGTCLIHHFHDLFWLLWIRCSFQTGNNRLSPIHKEHNFHKVYFHCSVMDNLPPSQAGHGPNQNSHGQLIYISPTSRSHCLGWRTGLKFWQDSEYSRVEGYATRACGLCALQYEALSVKMQDVKLLEWINVEIVMWKHEVWPARELLWRNRTVGKWNCLMQKGLGLFWGWILDWRSFIAWAVRILDFPKFIGKSMFQLKTISRCDSVTEQSVKWYITRGFEPKNQKWAVEAPFLWMICKRCWIWVEGTWFR